MEKAMTILKLKNVSLKMSVEKSDEHKLMEETGCTFEQAEEALKQNLDFDHALDHLLSTIFGENKEDIWAKKPSKLVYQDWVDNIEVDESQGKHSELCRDKCVLDSCILF